MKRLFLTATLALAAILGPHAPALATGDPVPAGGTSEAQSRGSVILLHGLLRSSDSLATMAAALTEAGYEVVNLDYPSTEISIAETSNLLAEALARCCSDPDRRVHFVTHSLGGIIVRFYLDHETPPGLGRVVMLSPPNSGSEVVDALEELELFKAGLGPAAQELSTSADDVPAQLGPVDFELGVITGNRSINPVFSWIIPGPDDGQVSVDGARVEGMADFLVVPHTHTFIMNSPEVVRQTLHFLEHGTFAEERP